MDMGFRADLATDQGKKHMPYAVFLAVAMLSCAAYAVLVHSGSEAATQPAQHELPATSRTHSRTPDAPQKTSRETAP